MVQDPRPLQLQELLELTIGSENVYFQPPAGMYISYPCIVYKLDDVDTKFAGNRPYRRTKRYQVTAITRDPDSDLSDKISMLPTCRFDRFYTADNLNHYVHNLYF